MTIGIKIAIVIEKNIHPKTFGGVKMKPQRFFLLVSALTAALLIPTAIFGQTYVSGNIGSGIWYSSGNPYIVIGDVTAYNLAINPGVEIIFDYNALFYIDNQLLALGTEDDSIHIHARASEWKGFKIENSDSISLLQYVIMEGAGSYYEVLDIDDIIISIKHCTFRDNNSDRIIAVNCSDEQYFQVEDCEFYDNNCENAIVSCSLKNFYLNGCKYYDNVSDRIVNLYEDKGYVFRNSFYNNECESVIQLEGSMIANCIFYNAVSPGFPIFELTGDFRTAEIQNCIIWEYDSLSNDLESLNIQYSDLFIPFQGQGNISVNPQFTDPTSGDFTLLENSPCIDTGNPQGWWYDLEGSRNDMGVYGGNGLIPLNTNIHFGAPYAGETIVRYLKVANLTDINYWFDNYFRFIRLMSSSGYAGGTISV